ncbi:MAG: formylglycine-generating enzyme family protein [Magnetococcales bacterium]|nr:formylglycine-generating enzyme family protein [Magnetococcales bacterium]
MDHLADKSNQKAGTNLYSCHSDEWRCPLTGMLFIWVPGGTFQMGGGNCSDSKPVHPVTLTGVWVGKYPVTQDEWTEIMGQNPSHCQKGGRHPVEQVSWNDVTEFIDKLNQRGDGNYRLPTEAEWEYACRAGGMGRNCPDKNDVDQMAWFLESSGGATHPVGEKLPNGLGLYDMNGNVLEWTSDWYDEQYYACSPQVDPPGPLQGGSQLGLGGPFSLPAGRYRVVRGGCFAWPRVRVTCTYRFGWSPEHRSPYVGVRLARSPEHGCGVDA